jgi:hypothetical protein
MTTVGAELNRTTALRLVQFASEFPLLRQAGDKRFSTSALLIIFIAGGL